MPQADGGLFKQPTIIKVGDAGPERLLNAADTRAYERGLGKGGVQVNLQNASGTPLGAQQTQEPHFDGKRWVVDIILEAMQTRPDLRGAIAGAR